MNRIPAVIMLTVLFIVLNVQNSGAAEEKSKQTTDVVFREPFILKLHVDKEHYYEEKIGKIPYVYENVVYLYSGDNFGINVKIVNNEISRLSYQKNTSKADVTFHFYQEVDKDGKQIMMLKIDNQSKQTIYFDALMTIPGKKGAYKTSILPVEPGIAGFEMWGAHTIVQLVLYNLRLNENSEEAAMK